jgi:hypothetical protein
MAARELSGIQQWSLLLVTVFRGRISRLGLLKTSCHDATAPQTSVLLLLLWLQCEGILWRQCMCNVAVSLTDACVSCEWVLNALATLVGIHTALPAHQPTQQTKEALTDVFDCCHLYKASCGNHRSHRCAAAATEYPTNPSQNKLEQSNGTAA